ncbi:hypothetical protein [Nocardia farcinica]|uniref:hypothetical protein n=1 Tax=Nocardia farcinica TaxID=37329 RepID=UPI001894501A|nr:hypothetical protein [Nocardia farcinica]MBF6374442.1 hypothetical protein [Nocardia farcinica]
MTTPSPDPAVIQTALLKAASWLERRCYILAEITRMQQELATIDAMITQDWPAQISEIDTSLTAFVDEVSGGE